MEPHLEEALRALGYPRAWLDLGLLPAELLLAQHQALAADDHASAEHYRYAAFRRLLEPASLPDAVVRQYLELTNQDPDAGMAEAAVRALLEVRGLTDAQFELVAERCATASGAKAARSLRLRRRLRRDGPTPEVLACCLEEGDARVHEALLAVLDLPRGTLEALAEAGATRRVRNLARSRLRARP